MKLTPPDPDEVEVSLFGPGFGECVLVHLGNQEWLIVDSCKDQRSTRQPALTYLAEMGLEASAAVRVVLVSHWHDDHVRGISEVVAECITAEFWVSSALRSEELLLMSGLYGSDRASKHNPFQEFYWVMERLRIRAMGRQRLPLINLATESRVLWHRPATRSAPEAEIIAFSPSSVSDYVARQAIANLLPEARAPPKCRDVRLMW